MNIAANPIIRLDGAGWYRPTDRAMRATCVLVHVPDANAAELSDDGKVVKRWADPLDALAWIQDSVRELPADARWIGYLSYDAGRWFESLPSQPRDDLGLPYFAFALCDEFRPDFGSRHTTRTTEEHQQTSTFTRDRYLAATQRVIDYIAAGDVFQVNLAQRLTVPLRAAPATVYERLRARAPASFGALLDFDSFALVSNSPELFLRVTPDRKIVNRPIKGTRPRGEGMERELRESAKDIAELAMIVDLQRNDLGRVCEAGSVRVVEPRAIEEHPTVYHGVATIEGMLRPDVSFVDLLRATFPCGSVTGAPKIRAMQIIDELEPVARGPYCGAIGYLAADGTIEFNVAIRTIVCKDGQAHVSVGGGIVADSDPQAEYEETLVKSRAMLAALSAE